MTSRLASIVTICALVLATIMTLALTASIALLFTIGKPTTPTSYSITTTPIGSSVITTTTSSTTTTTSTSSSTTTTTTTSDPDITTGILAEPCDCGCPEISPEISPRIVNGEAAIPNSWPWQLLVVTFSANGVPVSYCGGSLITPRHALTAAHCVFGRSPRYIGVIPRAHYFNVSSWSVSTSYMAQNIYAHEAYDDITLNHDVAVVHLRAAVPLDDRVGLACLAPSNLTGQELLHGAPLVATGWGALESVNRTFPSVLQQVRLQYIEDSNPLCAPLIGSGDNRRPGQMCTGVSPRAICFGDSGGPLVRSITHANGKQYWQQVGIVSGTVDCGNRQNYSDIFARVSYYNPWVTSKIRLSS